MPDTHSPKFALSWQGIEITAKKVGEEKLNSFKFIRLIIAVLKEDRQRLKLKTSQKPVLEKQKCGLGDIEIPSKNQAGQKLQG